VAAYLVERGADVNAADAGYTALHAAILRGDPPLVRALVAKGADPNTPLAKGTPSRYYSKDYAFNENLVGATPIWLAARFGEPDMMRALAAAGADLRGTMKDGTTVLMSTILPTRGLGTFRAGDRRERYQGPADVAAKGEGEDEEITVGAVAALDPAPTECLAAATPRRTSRPPGAEHTVQLLVDCGAKLDISSRELTPLGWPVRSPAVRSVCSGCRQRRKSTADLLRRLGAQCGLVLEGLSCRRRSSARLLSAVSAADAQGSTSPLGPGSLTALVQRPVPLRDGIGQAHEVVTTSSKTAQAFYDQGLAYLHSFVWIEAARSFNEALRADARVALAHVGLSYAWGELGDAEGARASAARAQARAASLSGRERLRVELRTLQLRAGGDAAAAEEYRSQLAAAAKRYATDVEILLLVGRAQDPSHDAHGMQAGSASLAFYERALPQAPDYFATHHYLAHAYENLGRTDRALENAAAFARWRRPSRTRTTCTATCFAASAA
jgi:tetratricopeptide (TPR) repeat protein